MGDALAALCIVENEEDQCPLHHEETSKIENCSLKIRRFSFKYEAMDRGCYFNHGVNENLTKTSDNYQKTNSLPSNSCITQNWDQDTCSALRLSPEDIANQLTLLDLPCFQAIRPEELTTCDWNKRNKITVAPNVVAFTRRFNQVSFWTVQEILNCQTPKARAEMIAHFIKTAKKLHEINNIHSMFAIISALQSASIFRLTKTWFCLAKKDKQLFDKLAELFVDHNNWNILREYLRSISLPCIPYLGLFLTDLVYIDMAHPLGSPHRSTKMLVILEAIANYQKSVYLIKPLPNVHTYLKSVRYIEELQKFMEDDQYKLSLKLEPLSPVGSSSGSKESVKGLEFGPLSGRATSFKLSPQHRIHSGAMQPKFLPGHRKSLSLGSKFRSTSLPRNFHNISSGGGILNKNYSINGGFDTGTLGSVNLLDDTVIESPISLKDNNLSSNIIPPQSTIEECNVNCQGFVRRKTIFKDGRKPSLSSWQRYWLQIWACKLVYFSPKSFKGSSRSDFRSEPCKMASLEGWSAVRSHGEAPDVFQLLNHHTSSLYKFKAGSPELANMWIQKIQEVTCKPVKPLPANLMSFE